MLVILFLLVLKQIVRLNVHIVMNCIVSMFGSSLVDLNLSLAHWQYFVVIKCIACF